MSGEIKSKFRALGFEIAEHSNDMFSYWDVRLICRYANHAHEEWFGLNPSTMIDILSLDELLGPLYHLNYPHIEAVLQGSTQIFEHEITRPTGEIRNTIATYSPDFENKEVKGFFMHVADVMNTKKESPTLFPQNGSQNQNHNPPVDEEVLDKICNSLRSSVLNGFPGIKNLAKTHFISESKLKRDFKEKFNATIFSFYRQLQMDLAEHYLIEKKFSKKQVAFMFNFSNTTNFAACFKKHLKQKANKINFIELEKKSQNLYKTFINQVPFAIAMLDENLNYVAFSKKWIEVFNINSQELIGTPLKNSVDGINNRWDDSLIEALKGSYETSDEDSLHNPDGKTLWLKWEIKPWYKLNQQIGGVIICADDITALKLKQIENSKILEILNKTTQIAKIGTWKRDFEDGTVIWSDTLKEIFEVPDDFTPTLEMALSFYKNEEEHEKVRLAIDAAITSGTGFDIKTTMETMKGRSKNVRLIGYPEFNNNTCQRLFGIFQEI